MPWFLLRLVLTFVFACVISGVLHELAHWFFFKRYKLPIVELSFGILRFINVNNRLTPIWTFNRPLDFFCACKGLRGINRHKQIICLLSGGATNLISAVLPIVCLLLGIGDNIRLYLYVIITACIINACSTMLNPYSADRKILKKLNKEENH